MSSRGPARNALALATYRASGHAMESALDDVQLLIATRRINHVPVLEGEKLVGVVTLVDLFRTHVDDIAGLNDELRRDISSPYTTRRSRRARGSAECRAIALLFVEPQLDAAT